MARFEASGRTSRETRARIGFAVRPGAVVLIVLVAATTRAADLGEAEDLFRSGRYDECARMAEGEIQNRYGGEPWSLLKARAELARGRPDAALRATEEGLHRSPGSVPLRLLAHEIHRANGRPAEAAAALDAIERLVGSVPQRFLTSRNRVALGRYLLLRGADARKVLDQFYDVVIQQHPGEIDAYFATAELALEKQDGALAAETLQKAPEEAAEDPYYHYLLARALTDDDRAASDEALAKALEINPHHVDSLLLRVDHRIDGERYDEAAEGLDRVLAIDPQEPRAWAYRAVLAHLKGDRKAEDEARRSALGRWATNPAVDHLIGRKLSQKYRFAEGSAYQRRALAAAPADLPAKLQLCQDLLRLGEEDEGWRLADEVFARDGYNVVAYNLATLRDRLSGFRTLRDGPFLVRMDPREAALYGPRVLDLLKRAHAALCEKYGATVEGPVVVEIFPRKKEFAVRTFGLPGADGLLGVCFGGVITAISPAAQGEDPSSWEAVLWHEFCHAVTLHKTRNTMPRWLSEGISVYEERQHDPAWGMPLDPRYRAKLLDDSLTPLSRLSAAFLGAKSALDLQFAYFESALAVEFLVDRAGLPALKGLLDDLGSGVLLDQALPKRAGMSLNQVDSEFLAFARRKAEAIAPDATWEEPDLPGDADSGAVAAWLEAHPRSFRGRQRLAARLVAEEKWEPAREALVELKAMYPEYVGTDNAYQMLATVYQKLGETAAERSVLEELAARDADAAPALLRLMELEEAAEDWRGLAREARRLLAVNPLVPAPHRRLARAAEHLGDWDEAVAAYRAVALLDDTDPAEVHFRLATLLRRLERPDEARREVLKALEEAPRFQEAHRLLLDLVGDGPPKPGEESAP